MCGSPGKGKTAFVNSILASADVAAKIRILFLNCTATTDMGGLWSRLAEELSAAASPADEVEERCEEGTG